MKSTGEEPVLSSAFAQGVVHHVFAWVDVRGSLEKPGGLGFHVQGLCSHADSVLGDFTPSLSVWGLKKSVRPFADSDTL